MVFILLGSVFKMTKLFIYTILLKAEMPCSLDRKRTSTARSVLDVDTLSLFSRGKKSNTFIFEPTKSLLLQKRQEAATGRVLKKAVLKIFAKFTRKHL